MCNWTLGDVLTLNYLFNIIALYFLSHDLTGIIKALEGIHSMEQTLWTASMCSLRMSKLKVWRIIIISADQFCWQGILMIGEIGGSAEERAAEHLQKHNTVSCWWGNIRVNNGYRVLMPSQLQLSLLAYQLLKEEEWVSLLWSLITIATIIMIGHAGAIIAGGKGGALEKVGKFLIWQ